MMIEPVEYQYEENVSELKAQLECNLDNMSIRSDRQILERLIDILKEAEECARTLDVGVRVRNHYAVCRSKSILKDELSECVELSNIQSDDVKKALISLMNNIVDMPKEINHDTL